MSFPALNIDWRGTARIPSEDFSDLLGTQAEVVWGYLVQLRDQNIAKGLVPVIRPKIETLMHVRRLSRDDVKRAFRRLHRAGLVQTERRFRLAAGGGYESQALRVVFGGRVGRDLVLVPTDLWPRVRALGKHGHGGRRKGAGRPSTVGVLDSSKVPKKHENTVGALDSPKALESRDAKPCIVGALELPKTNSSAPSSANSSAPLKHTSISDSAWLVPSLRSGTAAPQKPGAADLPALQETAPADPPLKGLTLVPDPPPSSPLKFDSLTARFQKQAEYALKHHVKPAVNYGSLGMPMWPPSRALGYTIISPPRVSPAKEREDQLAFCVKWYRSAVMSRLGRCPHIQLGGSTRRFFEDFLDICLEHEVRPGAWVAWALDRILLKLPANARKRFTPQVKILLSPKTLTESRWAYREAEPDYATPWFRPTTEGEHHLWRLRGLEADVFRLEDRSEANVTALVALHFPEGYPAALKKVREKSDQSEQEVLARIQLGHWVWPIPHRELRRVG